MKLPAAIYFFLLLEVVIVAVIDIKTKKIWNMWTLVNMAFAILCVFLFREHYPVGWSLVEYPLYFLVGGFILWLLKIMGAGDVKYLFSFFLLVPSALHDQTFTYLLYTTILIGLSVLMYNVGRRFSFFWMAFRIRDREMLKQVFGTKFSYAPSILLTWIWLGWGNKEYIYW